MTEFELITVFNDTSSNMLACITLFLTILFAYFVVAHVAGKSISTKQLIIVNLVYSAVMLLVLSTLASYFYTNREIVKALVEIDSQYLISEGRSSASLVVSTVIYFLGYAVSLFYMKVCREKAI